MLFYKVGPLLKKQINREFCFLDFWSLGFSLKGDIKGLFFPKEKKKATIYRSENKIFLSIVERKIFSC